MMFHIFLLCLLCTALGAPPTDDLRSPRDTTKCGYTSCHKTDPEKLNVHLVPHSHDDVGWKRTVDQYYFGNNEKDHMGIRGVEDIINSVVQSLNEDPNRRFIQVETAFFARWWETQTDEIKTMVKELVNNGQLEMVSGGWSMNDEAATNYQSIIDQMTPRVGWQIDPFGHTNAMATVLAELGFDGLFFWRLDYRDSEARQTDRRTEFVWRGNSDLGSKSDIFTSLLYENYNAPLYFCWDIQCGDEPIIDDKSSTEYNVKRKVDQFHKRIAAQAKNYQTNNILITMGGDFTYQAAEMYYVNIDRLIKGFQEFHPEINMIYSTPSCYLNAVRESAERNGITFPLETNDFMPYATSRHTYWTGYYSSRPNSKRFERQGNNLLQVAKHLVAFENAKNKSFEGDVIELKKIMGVMQHHDAITGTEKQHVTDDYVRMLTNAMQEAQKSIHTMIFDLLKYAVDDESVGATLNSCLLSNVTRCAESGEQRFTVAVYNPHGHTVSHFVRVPVVSTKYSVAGLHGGKIPFQISPVIDTFSKVPGTQSLYELTFKATDIPPLGVNYFYITKEDSTVNEPNLIEPSDKTVLGTESTGIEIDSTTGLLKSVTLNGVNQVVSQQFLYYQSSNASGGTRSSGAYVFRPSAGTEALIISDKTEFVTYQGEIFDEVHQKFNDWLKQSIRVYKNENYIEFDWIVGPLSYVNKLGIEVITRYITDLDNEATFYTDSNGRQLIKRVRNHRPTYEYTNEEPISGNYYPVTSRIVIKDKMKKIDMAILNDRSQGGSSLTDGQVELMIHRRLMNDDEFGVEEVLNEREYGEGVIVRGQHYLFSGFMSSLPDNVRLLTLESFAPNKLLLRLEHPFSKDDDEILGKPVIVDLKDLLTLYTIKSVSETTLGSNQLKSDNVRLQFPIKGNEKATGKELTKEEDETLKVTLNPMEIRTFILDVEARQLTRITGSANIHLPHTLLTLLFIAICVFH
ncbi:hypothetical protein RI129_010750 [Pyrocoelia pectoralis]|uniref:Alpha-mannosidase n=1 Tax=Pyrocoelia pectoralis TaxID=417401 RepID=A0AAN7V4U0_9COLE